MAIDIATDIRTLAIGNTTEIKTIEMNGVGMNTTQMIGAAETMAAEAVGDSLDPIHN